MTQKHQGREVATIRINPLAHQLAKIAAAEAGMTLTAWIEHAIANRAGAERADHRHEELARLGAHVVPKDSAT
jgi:hypothetical protein